jgi:hypothetical protein
MPQRLLHKAQVLIKRNLSTHHLGFLTNHKILTKRGWRELTKAYDECISWVSPASSKGGRGKAFLQDSFGATPSNRNMRG